MNTYIALLRGINVSGQKKIKMADLKIMFEDLGYQHVITYIQSGNVVFQHKEEPLENLGKSIKDAILKTFGYDVAVLVINSDTLKAIFQNNPFSKKLQMGEIEDKKMYFTLLSSNPDSSAIQELSSTSYEPEEFVITNNVVYFYAANGYGRTKLNNNFFEKKLNCSATTRNLKTLVKLIELSDL